MKFSKQSKEYMELFIPYMDTFIKKQNVKVKKQLDLILKIIYINLQRSSFKFKYMMLNHTLYKNLISIDKNDDLLKDSFLASLFVPKNIQKNIVKTTTYKLHYRFTVETQKVNVIFGIPSILNIEKYDVFIKNIFMWLQMIKYLAPKSCHSPLDIIIFPTAYKKHLPSNEIDVLSPLHINSAVTLNCSSKNKILIFRKEEWFKVFVHETFHNYNLDFSHLDMMTLNKNLHKIFPLKIEFNAYEAYSEFWATIINSVICSFNMVEKDDDEDFETFVLYTELCISFERIFSLVQCVKILKYMNLEYIDLHKPTRGHQIIRDILYKEKTSVFSYYILKTILLNNYEDFLYWCYFQNIPHFIKFKPTRLNMKQFVEFINKHYKNPQMLQSLKTAKTIYNKICKHTSKKSLNKILNTTRMTICELN